MKRDISTAEPRGSSASTSNRRSLHNFPKISEYCLLNCSKMGDLENCVQKKIKEGWQPIGGPCVVEELPGCDVTGHKDNDGKMDDKYNHCGCKNPPPTKGTIRYSWTQAVVKYEKD